MAVAVCFGELLVDMVSDTADASLAEAPRFLKAPGGAPANVAVGLARQGVPTRFISQVGDDPFGVWLRDTIAHEGVDVTALLTSPSARTTIAFVATRNDGRKDICFYRNPGADAEITPSVIQDAMFEGARLFHCGSVSLSQSPTREAQLHAVQMAKARGLLISYDPNWRPSLWTDHDAAREVIWAMLPFCDIVKLADEEWEFITETTDFAAGAAKIRACGPRLVLMTRGAAGAAYDCSTAHGEAVGFSASVVDTLGAGDAFMAGLLSQVLARGELDASLNAAALSDILRFANACGALSTQQAGAIPGLPTRAEIERFMR